MRLGIVRGTVVLSVQDPSLEGTRFLLVEPIVPAALAARDGSGGGKTLVVADHLAPAVGQMVAFVEGREAANPYWPGARSRGRLLQPDRRHVRLRAARRKRVDP